MSAAEKNLDDLEAIEEMFHTLDRRYKDTLAQVRRYEQRIAWLEGELASTQLVLERVTGAENLRVLHRPDERKLDA